MGTRGTTSHSEDFSESENELGTCFRLGIVMLQQQFQICCEQFGLRSQIFHGCLIVNLKKAHSSCVQFSLSTSQKELRRYRPQVSGCASWCPMQDRESVPWDWLPEVRRATLEGWRFCNQRFRARAPLLQHTNAQEIKQLNQAVFQH